MQLGPAEIEGIYASLADQRVGGLIVGGDNLFFMLRDKLFALAEKYKVPAIYHYPEHATVILSQADR